ncbi:unnamed protein product [Rotaria magnacalcarata]|uniref:Uncharacterized protein n=3 Tax=Rotaria magnacalcarata TaxID=392030 RepID=A0A816HBV8_9BILA|nr:unnamed protein product [Rotaria magnacalcarata]
MNSNSSTTSKRTTNSKSINTLTRTTDSNSKNISSASSNKKKTTPGRQNSLRRSTADDVLAQYQRLSLSPSFCNAPNVSKTTFLIHSLVEGSLEYRKMKRLYLGEKQQTEEWRKDYNVLKRQVAYLKSSTISRPTAEMLDWLQELFDIMCNNGAFRGDGRCLNTIGGALGQDETSLVGVAARTPQKSALKLFRLLYPTIGSRVKCGSVSKVPKEQLENIYIYVRGLHRNFNFIRTDLRKAIGTSIRSATCELRKIERHRQQQLNSSQDDENVDSNESDQARNASNDMEIFSDGAGDIAGPDDDVDDFDNEDDGASEKEDLVIDEDIDDEDDHFQIMMTDDDNEIPLHSVKSLVRRLKNSHDRVSRNADVFSMDHSSTKDVEVMNNRYRNDYLQVDEIGDVTMQEQNEELSSSSTTSEDPIDYAPDTNLSSMISGDDHESNSYQTAQDPVSDNVQSFLPDARQISSTLALFRHRHSLSKSCINDLCELLCYLGAKGVSTEFCSIERNILQNQQNILQSKKYTVCSKCRNKGNITSKCENVKCESRTDFQSTSTTLCILKLLPQITSILERQAILPESDNNCSRINP